ncbi:MAG TPA: hypothetical protein VFG84_07255, partial [Gemmatimonadaceae bacterium]|nr:hypothetical protein [Gemmatimonadaceae bacterium]
MLHNAFMMRVRWLPCALFACIVAGCSDSDDPVAPDDDAIAELRTSVEPLRDLAAAQAAGYDVVVVHPVNSRTCLRDSQLGAMGVHYLNGALVDDTVIASAPE